MTTREDEWTRSRVGRTLLASALLFAAACGDRGWSSKTNYDDVPRLDVARTSFGCHAPETPTHARACAVIAEFEGGVMPTTFPEVGKVQYMGRSLCAKDDPEGGMTFKSLVAMPGVSGQHVEARRLPVGLHDPMSVLGRYASVPPETWHAAGDAVVDALRDGRRSFSTALPSTQPFPRDFAAWRTQLAPLPISTAGNYAKSDGQSVLVSPGKIGAWWDDFDRLEAYTVLRAVDGGYVALTPHPNTQPLGTCVTRYYRIPDTSARSAQIAPGDDAPTAPPTPPSPNE